MTQEDFDKIKDDSSMLSTEIKKNLLTAKQLEWLNEQRLTVEDVISKRLGVWQWDHAEAMFDDWNTKLRFVAFQYVPRKHVREFLADLIDNPSEQ